MVMEIPDDVMKAAIEAMSQEGWWIGESGIGQPEGLSAWQMPGDIQYSEMRVEPIARAILAERRKSIDLIQSLSFAAKCYLISTRDKHSGSETYKAIEDINKRALEYLAEAKP